MAAALSVAAYCTTSPDWDGLIRYWWKKTDLTAGSTWHAAGNVTFFGHYPSITRLYVESLSSYLDAQAESGLSIGFHQCGSLRLATTTEEIDAYTRLESIYQEMEITLPGGRNR